MGTDNPLLTFGPVDGMCKQQRAKRAKKQSQKKKQNYESNKQHRRREDLKRND